MEQGQTITEAAARLGVGERRLRRLLLKPVYRDRTVTTSRETRTGTRTGVTIPPDLFVDLEMNFRVQDNAALPGAALDSFAVGQQIEVPPVRGGGTLTRREQVMSEFLAAQGEQVRTLQSQLSSLTQTVQTQADTIAALTRTPAPDVPVKPARPWWRLW